MHTPILHAIPQYSHLLATTDCADLHSHYFSRQVLQFCLVVLRFLLDRGASWLRRRHQWLPARHLPTSSLVQEALLSVDLELSFY